MNGPLEWIAAIGTMLAAGLIAIDLGRKVTGFGFVLFCFVSITWIVWPREYRLAWRLKRWFPCWFLRRVQAFRDAQLSKADRSPG